MKEINDLKAKANDILDEMREIVEKSIDEGRTKTPKEKIQYNELDRELKEVQNKIKKAEEREKLNQLALEGNDYEFANTSFNKGTKSYFRNFLNETLESGREQKYNLSLRADPILTTTDSDMINKTVEATDVLYSPTEELLKVLGVKMYNNVNGNLVLPRLTQDTATWPGEDASAASADMAPDSNTLSATRVTHYQSITREALAQTNPELINTIIDNLYNGIWNAVAAKLFDEIDTDCASQLCDTSGTVSFSDIVNLEASLGSYNLKYPAYVMKPETKAYLKKTAALTNQEAIWKENKVNEYKAFATPYSNTERIYFGDWDKTVVASFGPGIEIIVDPYSDAKRGLITITAIGLFDCGVANKNAFSIISDASTF